MSDLVEDAAQEWPSSRMFLFSQPTLEKRWKQPVPRAYEEKPGEFIWEHWKKDGREGLINRTLVPNDGSAREQNPP
mgnify:CR=1 FL=1